MKVKLCGFTEKESLQIAIDQKCDFLGFVFCKKSPRYITPQNAATLALLIPTTIAKVAVVADTDFTSLTEITQKLHPDFLQFHGNETVNQLKDFHEKFPKVKIIKAFRISAAEDLMAMKNFENCADFFLFDSSAAGSGKKFDWEILRNFSCTKPWFLSGGLNSINIPQALEITGAEMIDVSSGIEEIRGKKSSKLIIEFMQRIRDLCSKK